MAPLVERNIEINLLSNTFIMADLCLVGPVPSESSPWWRTGGTKCKFYVTVQAVPSGLRLSLNVMGLTIINESSRPEVDVRGQSTYGLRVVRLVRSDFLC